MRHSFKLSNILFLGKVVLLPSAAYSILKKVSDHLLQVKSPTKMLSDMRAFLAIVTVCCMTGLVTGTLQQLTFFQSTGCKGESDRITDTRNELNSTWIGVHAASMQVVGPWRVSANKRPGNGQPVGLTYAWLGSTPPNGTCADWIYAREGYTIHSAERLGGADMAVPQVVFYTEENFNGEKFTVDRNMSTVGTQPFESLSYILFSNSIWEVYPGQNFTGAPVYIGPASTGVEDPADNFAFNLKEKYVVGSVRKLEPGTIITTTTISSTAATTEQSSTSTTTKSPPTSTTDNGGKEGNACKMSVSAFLILSSALILPLFS